VFVNADPARLIQMMDNPLHNAVKFTPRGARTTFSAGRSCDGDATFAVRNTGIGIPPEVLSSPRASRSTAG
jgi:signal transduction histidine kinase